jgi:hypothetical protein
MKRLLGVIALLMGSAILLWVGYNLFIERQPESKDMNPLPAIGFSVVLIVVGVLWVRGKPVG